jgi:hypothetical protein
MIAGDEPGLCVPGRVWAATVPHDKVSKQGLDLVAVYDEEGLPALCVGESKASHTQFEQRFAGSGLAKLEQLKADGQDPTHGGEARAKRGSTNARRKAELREWEQQYGKLVDLSTFEREILPQIQDVPLSRLVKATGLSLRYVSQIRRGEKAPHPRHWQAFQRAATGIRQ